MEILKTKREIRDFLALLKKRASGENTSIEKAVGKILSDVRKEGDRAVIRYTEKFDSITIQSLRLSLSEISKHADKADKKIIKSLERSAKRIYEFHAMQKEESWCFSEEDTILGQIVRPLQRQMPRQQVVHFRHARPRHHPLLGTPAGASGVTPPRRGLPSHRRPEDSPSVGPDPGTGSPR